MCSHDEAFRPFDVTILRKTGLSCIYTQLFYLYVGALGNADLEREICG